MKKVALIFMMMFVSYISLSACEISFKVISNSKAKYKAGEEFVAKLTVVLNHRNCNVDIGATELIPDGLQVVSATKWSEASDGSFERKLKIKVNGNKSNKPTLKAIRKCKKDGGQATLKIAMG